MKETIVKVKYYLKSYLKWIFIGPRFFWLSCLLTFFPLLLLFLVSFEEANLIRIGAFFQIIGVLSIFYEIYQIRKQFETNSFKDLFKIWLRKRPRKYGSKFYIEPEGIQISAKPLNVTLTTVPHWDEKKDVEDNVKALINWVERNRISIDKTNQELKTEISKTYNSLYKKLNESNSKIGELGSAIEDNATGSLKTTFIGSLWIFIGVLFATVPTDLIFIIDSIFKN